MANTNTTKKNIAWLPTVLAYLLSLLLVLLALVGMVALTVCSPRFFKQQIQKSDFSNHVRAELKENYLSYGIVGGFSAQVMESLISTERIQNDMYQTIDRLYDSSTGEQSYADLHQKSLDTFIADIKARGYSVTPEVEKGLVSLADACTLDYSSHVGIPFASYLRGIFTKIQAHIWLPLAVLLSFSAICIVLLLLNVRRRTEKIRYLTYSVSAAALLCVLLPLFARSTLHMERFNISPASLQNLLAQYVNSFFGTLLYFAAGYVIVLVILHFLSVRIRRNQADRHAASSNP
ncbi:MAG: hypothetical protein RR859_04785 [Ruthenibacterium sp.]